MLPTPIAAADRVTLWRDPPVPAPVRDPAFANRPFALSSDPAVAYHSVAYDRAVQELLGAIGRRESAVVLTGDPGVGKTTLCRAVAEQLDRRTVTSLVLERPVSAEDLLATVLIDLGVISRNAANAQLLTRADLDAAFHDFLTSLAPLQAFAVLIIDEAQDLPADAFEWLTTLADTLADRDDRERLLQVVLVGRPSLLSLLDRAALRPLAARVSVRCTLDPLTRAELPDYVAHRLSLASLEARVTFDGRALAHIYELSRGVPAVVNVLCERTIEEGHRASTETIDEALVRTTAERLDVELPSAGRAWVRTLAAIVILLLFLLAGAAAALFLFREEVAALVGP